jgi:hypothetical protein
VYWQCSKATGYSPHERKYGLCITSNARQFYRG